MLRKGIAALCYMAKPGMILREAKKKKSKGACVAIAVLMFLSALISFVNRVYDRKQIIKAISADEDVKLIVASSRKEKL